MSSAPSLNRKSVELTVNGRRVEAVVQNPGMWSIVSIDVEGLPRLPPYRESSFKSEADAIEKIREIVAAYV